MGQPGSGQWLTSQPRPEPRQDPHLTCSEAGSCVSCWEKTFPNLSEFSGWPCSAPQVGPSPVQATCPQSRSSEEVGTWRF